MRLLILLGPKFNPLKAYLLKISRLMINSRMINSPLTNSRMTNSLPPDLLKVAGLARLGA
ncbi:MAG: hypothetical protein QUV06_07080 [Cyanobium sp. CZS 48M]|nr:hypothetical protein [Cyanobium sp. CZS48M]